VLTQKSKKTIGLGMTVVKVSSALITSPKMANKCLQKSVKVDTLMKDYS